MSTDPQPQAAAPTPPDGSDPPEAPEAPFDPAKHLSQISGRDYLEVKWRLVWLRDLHPEARITTDLVEHTRDETEAVVKGWALFRAVVTLPGGGSASGWGSESSADFGDYLEKAETKAIGRALAALGFGTQFCADHDDGAGAGRPVDSPVDFTQRARQPGGAPAPASERQLRAAYAIGRHGGLTDAQIVARAQQQHGCHPEQLTVRQASAFIDALKQELTAPRPPAPDDPPAAATPAPLVPRPPAPPTAAAATPPPAATYASTRESAAKAVAAGPPPRVTAAPGSQGQRPSAEAFNRLWTDARRRNWRVEDVQQTSQDCYGRPVDQLLPAELELLQRLIRDQAELKQVGDRPTIVPLTPVTPAGHAG